MALQMFVSRQSKIMLLQTCTLERKQRSTDVRDYAPIARSLSRVSVDAATGKGFAENSTS